MFFRSLNFRQLVSTAIIGLSLITYIYFCYYTERHEHISIGLCVLGLFTFYILLLKLDLPTGLMIKIGLVFRLIILISTPNLSQDFYRFFWDGQLILNGFNPYLNTPKSNSIKINLRLIMLAIIDLSVINNVRNVII